MESDDVATDLTGSDDVVIRHRDDGSLELRVNGVFVMDDQETSSERLLAQHVLDLGARDVLVGGLGLGYTAQALIDGGARRVVVAELHAHIVEAMRTGQIPGADLLADPRLTVDVRDVREVVFSQSERSLDAILLDVDNGPDALVHGANAAVYRDEFITVCTTRLRNDGHLSVWSMADSDQVRAGLDRHFESVRTTEVPVNLRGHHDSYWLLTGSRPTGR